MDLFIEIVSIIVIVGVILWVLVGLLAKPDKEI
jgi:uncharacterized membrane protein YuzA (DUF378 family)